MPIRMMLSMAAAPIAVESHAAGVDQRWNLSARLMRISRTDD